MRKIKQIPESRLMFLILTGILLFLVGVVILTSGEAVQFRPLISLTFLVNITLFMTQMIRAVNKHPFSFDMMHWLFCLFFLGYAPFLQHMTNTYFWDLVPTRGEVLCANLVYLLWSGCYILGRDYRQIPKLRQLADLLAEKTGPVREKIRGVMPDMDGFCGRLARSLDRLTTGKKPLSNARLEAYRTTSLKTKVLDLLLAAAVLCALADILTVGLLAQISRSTASVDTGSTALNLIATHGVNNLLLFVAVVFVLEAKKARKLDWRTITALVCLFIACFPTGLSRNMMASFYAGLLIVTFDQTRKGRWFSWIIIGGLILIFPAVEIFRRLKTLQQGNLMEMVMESFTASYLQAHFDSHQMFISIARYVKEFGLSWGKQLLGALLFFVPRSLWPGKPEGTGHTAILKLDQFYFTNVSANPASEGYVNFGVLGIVLFAVVTGILIRCIDKAYWHREKNHSQTTMADVLYPFAMFMFFFLMRGDMMSAWGYTFAQLVVGGVIFLVYRFALKYGEHTQKN